MSDEPIDLVPVLVVQRLEKEKNEEEQRRREVEKKLEEAKVILKDATGEFSQRPSDMMSRLQWLHDRAVKFLEENF